jgi:WD40 repeat protein/transcriptional regulator with XRE-family HTH domain
MKNLYGEQDSAFGQAILTLRTALGLTQGRQATLLGVSRRAVGQWEAGNSYPKAEHLKHLIELGVQHQAFPAGHEDEAIRRLWKAAHQKVLLDEQWLYTLLGQWHIPLHHDTPLQTEVASEQTLPRPRLDWDDALALPTFYGREQEQALLTQWIVQERCRVVSVLGMGGIGKSALTVHVMHQLAEHCEVVLFRSLRDAPSCETLLDSCLQVLSLQPLSTVPADLEERISLLLAYLRKYRVLLVLDNLETLLAEGDVTGQYRAGFEGYKLLLHQVAGTEHQSCLLLTSREKLAELRPLEGKLSLVRSLRLSGLDIAACEQLLAEKDVVGTPQERARLIKIYGGNPLALKIVAETISDLFDGEIAQFSTEDMVIFGGITDLLSEQFNRLSALEQTVLFWLAIMREPLTLDELLALLVTPLPRTQVLEAIDSLRRRSLIECGKHRASFTLQSVILEYVTEKLITEGASEILHSHLDRLTRYGLELASAREYVRQIQERLLVAPLLAHLQNMYQRQAEVEEQLLLLLDQLRARTDQAQGYGPANLLALLRLQQGHLRNLDLSQLTIRGAYLQNIEMQDTSLAGALIRNSTFTEALDATWAVAISHSGQYWAAGSKRGEVRVWCEGGQSLYLAWQAHTDNTYTIAFSPDERTLASGSWDGTLKLWDLDSGALFWTGWQTGGIRSVAFSPDGQVLASGGADATVQFWDPQSGMRLQTLRGEHGPVYSLAWSPDGRLLACGCFDGCIQLWEMQKEHPSTRVQIFTGHTNWVTGLAFAPNSTQLASASWDQTVRLWEVTCGSCLQTLRGHTDRVLRVAWSPDGSMVASAGFDKTIWLWDVTQGCYRAMLREHTAEVYDIAFTPDSSSLLSGSEDSTLRVWDVESGRCIRIVQGYAIALYDLAWSPNSVHLASAGSDTQVTIWDVAGRTLLKVLHGHRWIVFGVAWSPDGHLLASSGWDNTIRLWDQSTGSCIHILQDRDDPNTEFQSVAWSPDGQFLASGSYLCGVQVWNVATLTCGWVGRAQLTNIRCVAWSPNGTRLASSGDDGSICLWNSTDGVLLQTLHGHSGLTTSVVWSPDGSQLVSGGGGQGRGELFLWDVQSGEIVRTFASYPGVIYAVTWGLGGDLLISGDSDGRLRWWNTRSGECVKTREGHQGTIQALRVSPDGRWLASCGDDGAIMLWDLHSDEYLCTLRCDRPYERLNITRVKGLNKEQKRNLLVLGANEEK